MSRLLTSGIIQQKRKAATLGFEPYVAATGFDRTAQSIDIYSIFNTYYNINNAAKWIYRIKDTATTFITSGGTSYRYGYTSGGVDYTYDLSNLTNLSRAHSGNTTYVDVDDTTGFPATGTLYIGSGQPFIYTSKTATRFSGANQNVSQLDNAEVRCSAYTIDFTGTTKRWVVVNHHVDGMRSCGVGGITAIDWLYCGNSVSSISCRSSSVTTVHINDRSQITTISYESSRDSQLTGTLYIGENVGTIYSRAFQSCTLITGLVFDDNSTCTAFEDSCFYNCRLSGDLTVPDSVISIGNSFSPGNYTTGTYALTFGTGLQTIGAGAFASCTGFTNILAITSNITSIGQGAFAYCNFSGIDVSANSSRYHVHDYILYQESNHLAIHGVKGYSGAFASSTLESDTLIIGDYCCASNTGRTGALIIPDSVTYVGISSFIGITGITSLTFNTTSDCITIKYRAFHGDSGIRGDLFIPDTVTTIETGAFQSCPFNGTLTFGTGSSVLATIGERVWQSCNFTGNLIMPDTITSIGVACWYGNYFTGAIHISTSLVSGPNLEINCTSATESLVIPNSVTSIGNIRFPNTTGTLTIGTGSNLSLGFIEGSFTGTLTIPSNVATIAESCFLGNRFSSITNNSTTNFLEVDNILYDIKTPGQKKAVTAANGSTGTITLESDTTAILSHCFYNSLRTGGLSIPNSVTTINASAFYNADSISGTISIGTGIATLASRCFGAMSGAVTVFHMHKSTQPTTASDAFYLTAWGAALHIPTGSSSYSAAPWTTTTIFATKTADL